MKLSILIPTIPERKLMFDILIDKLNSQITYCKEVPMMTDEVELLFDDSEKFVVSGITVGEKRNRLLQRATGDYLCYLDDDDDIAPNYVETLLRLCEQEKDICSFNSFFVCDTYWSLIYISIGHQENEQATPDRIILRKPFPICPVKTELAKKEQFSFINNAEDWEWMERVLTHVNTEAKTNTIIHSYRHSSSVSAVDSI